MLCSKVVWSATATAILFLPLTACDGPPKTAEPVAEGMPSEPKAAPDAAPNLKKSPAAFPLVFKDDLGAEVTLPAPPLRIVTLLPGLTETVCTVGACERLVAVDDYSNWPTSISTLPRVGALLDLNVEAIVAAKPDLVLASLYTKGIDQLRSVGIPVAQVSLEDYDDVFESIRSIGKMVGNSEDAETVAVELSGRIASLEDKARLAGGRPTVYYEIDATPYSVGPESFVGTLIKKAGGVNIVPEDVGNFPRISPELVLSADPEVIVLTVRGENGAEAMAKRPGWGALKAVKAGRVCELTPGKADRVVRASPRVDEGLAVLIACLHSEG